MNFFQKWVVSTIKDAEIEHELGTRINRHGTIIQAMEINRFVHRYFPGHHVHKNPRRNHDISRNDTE